MNRPLIQIEDKDLMNIIKSYKAIRLRNFFDRKDGEFETYYINLLEITAFIDAERIDV